jgi:effector-binding domain-containing protein
MQSKPKLDQRSEQQYVGIRTQVPMQDMPAAIDKAFTELFAWLGTRGIAPAGAPLIRYHIINMTEKMDIEMGVPIAAVVSGDERVCGGTLPAGCYASLIHTGHYSGLIETTRVLIEWAKANGIMWDRWDDPQGDAFRSRLEIYLTNPAEVPDSSQWQTEIAIKLADA